MNGLSSAEVKSRQQQGLDNSYVANPSKSNWDIIRGNTFTLFNVTACIIAAAVLAVGSFINSLFILLIIFNIVLGIVVEIRARRIIDKLTLLNTDPVTAIRDGKQEKVTPQSIVLDEVLLLKAGDQVPTDVTITSGYVEVNEALLTGESKLLGKQQGAELLSGSFIVSGQCYACVRRVGADNYSTKLAIEAKQYRPIDSGLMRALGIVMKFVSWIALPLGIILLFQALFMSHVDTQTAILATTAGLLGMIPRGMVVLIAVTLVAGVVKLGRREVLVQEMYSIETMAHLDTLCLDKTGTITEGKMQLVELISIGDKSEEFVQGVLRNYVELSSDANSTMKALKQFFASAATAATIVAVADDKNFDFESTADSATGPVVNQTSNLADGSAINISHVVPFSSHRKWGAICFEQIPGIEQELSGLGTVVLGAPEKLSSCDLELVRQKQAEGYRVLLLGYSKVLPSVDCENPEVIPLAILCLDDPVREKAAETLDYLHEQGVQLKIISGDNPETVSVTAKRAGFECHGRYLDASKLSDAELTAAIEETSIFGRVSPHQKKLIVTTLRESGKTVGMTGDGVNDILAMREANLSIAMATGDAATKQIANIVLLNSDFSDMPDILYEARRVVNNMLRSASIFFIKTIYSLFIVLTSSLSMLAGNLFLFPFVAIQVTLADQTIGWPTFYFSFKKDRRPVVKNFLRTALMRALPNALLITASFIFIHFYSSAQNWENIDSLTLMYSVLGIITFFNVARACWPLNLHNLIILILTLGGFFAGLHFIGPFIGLGTLNAVTLPILAAITALSFAFWLLWIRVIKI